MTVAQTMEVSTQSMEVVRGLFNDMRTVMEGLQTFQSWSVVLC
jgi:hypothetical protein